jgi:ABC-type ATPase with predicted acetyltransferase domain
MQIWCCGCDGLVNPRLTDGLEIYPYRTDLHKLPFWKCDVCGNYVGCHHKTETPTKPLGCIPTDEIKNARKHIHRVIDTIWKSKKMSRGLVYSKLSSELGYEYHTAEIRDLDEARKIYKLAVKLNGQSNE